MHLHVSTPQAALALQFCLATASKHPWGCRIDAGVVSGRGVCRFTIADINGSAIASIPADVEEAGTVVVNPRLLAEILGTFGGGDTEIGVEDESISITNGQAEAVVRTIEASTFPQIQLLDPTTAITVDAPGFSALAGLVLPAASDDMQRPTLRGVHVAVSDAGMQLTATDSYRMARGILPGPRPSWGEVSEVLVPASELAHFLRRIPSGVAALQIAANDRAVQFEATDEGTGCSFTLHAQQVEGSFPDVARILRPVEPVGELTVSPSELRAAVSGALVVTKGVDGGSSVTFEIAEDSLTVVGTSRSVGHLRFPVGCGYRGEALTISLSAGFLLDVLPKLSGAVTFTFGPPSHPVRVECPDVADFIYILMPLDPRSR